MKIAHFAIFAPHASGQYETVRELILAERSIGIDARLIDYGTDTRGTSRVGLSDREITTVPVEWALNTADVVIRHTSVPDEVLSRKPVLLAMHGRPESSFKIEQNGKAPVLSAIQREIASGRYQAIFTFWEEHLHYWKHIHNANIYYVPPPVDFNTYCTDGDRHGFGNHGAGVNLIACDMWRDDQTPFNLIFAAQYYRDHFNKDAKLHLYGVPNVKSGQFCFLRKMQRDGVIGEVGGVVDWLPKVYRSADAILTPNIIATRIIRESMASGLPVIAPHGCQYSEYRAEPRDYKSFAAAIDACVKGDHPDRRSNIRSRAIEMFNPRATGTAVARLCEKVLGSCKAVYWNSMSISESDWEILRGFIAGRKVETVVEFGCGVSTGLFCGEGLKVVSLETNKAFGEKVKSDSPEATICLWDGRSTVKVEGDMALIDGPHGGRNREFSYRSVAESSIPVVACHDMRREEDRQWVDKYFADWKSIIGTNDLLILERP